MNTSVYINMDLKKQRKENRNLISRPPCVAGGVVSASKVLAEELRRRYERSVSLMSIVTSTRKTADFSIVILLQKRNRGVNVFNRD